MRSRIIELGHLSTEAPYSLDVDIVLRSNLLLQANSGGGKSWTLRRIAEQAFPLVPQIIIDVEGEFSTLRSKFDFVLVGKGGDTPVDLRSAELLAHRLLELGASAVIDLFEVSKAIRVQWVAAFLNALVDAPKRLWRDLLIYVDEAHELAPEPGHGTERADIKACRAAMIDLAAKGRKRGYGVIAATQRLGKLSKDFAAELKNILIGQTFIDIDRERAAEALGISKTNKLEFFNNVKVMPPGRFYGFGRAMTGDPTLMRVGKVMTEHPEAGRRQSAPPPPTKKILHLLPQLSDLPKEAEQKVLTEKELRARIVELEREVAKKPTGEAQVIEKPVLEKDDLKRLEVLVEKLTKGEERFVGEFSTWTDTLAQWQQAVVSELGNTRTLLTKVVHAKDAPTQVPARLGPQGVGGRAPNLYEVAAHGNKWYVSNSRTPNGTPAADSTDAPPLPEKSIRMLGALKQGEAMGRQSMLFKHVAVIAGVAPDSGTTSNRKGELVKLGLIAVLPSHFVKLTDAGRAYPTPATSMPPSDPAALLEFWQREIGTEKIARMLEVVVLSGPISNEDLAKAVGMENSGTFSNYKGELTRRGLIEKVNGMYQATEVFRR